MAKWRIAGVVASGLLLWFIPGCRFLEQGPSDEEIRAAVRKSPPSPPTLGPMVLTEVASVEIQQRGRYNSEGRYWPIRVRVSGRMSVKPTNLFQLGLVAARKASPEPVDFVEETRFTKDDYGNWRAFYNYDAAGPRWRLDTH